MRTAALVLAFLLLATPALVEAGQKGRWKSKKKKKKAATASVEVGADGSAQPAGEDEGAVIKRLKDAGYDVTDPNVDHTQKGIDFDKEGDRPASLAAFKAATTFAENPTVHMNYGVALMRNQKLKEAREYLDKAVEMDPADSNLQANVKALENAEKEMGITGPPPSMRKKGKKKYQRPGGKKNKYQRPGGKKKNKYQRPGGKKDEKEDDGYDPEDPNADHTSIAIKYDGQGRKAESIAAFGAAAKHSPDVVTHQMNYAVSLMRTRQYRKALPHMEKAVELLPDDAQVKDNMAALTQSISVDDDSEEAVALRKLHPGRFDKKQSKKAKRKKKYQ